MAFFFLYFSCGCYHSRGLAEFSHMLHITIRNLPASDDHLNTVIGFSFLWHIPCSTNTLYISGKKKRSLIRSCLWFCLHLNAFPHPALSCSPFLSLCVVITVVGSSRVSKCFSFTLTLPPSKLCLRYYRDLFIKSRFPPSLSDPALSLFYSSSILCLSLHPIWHSICTSACSLTPVFLFLCLPAFFGSVRL